MAETAMVCLSEGMTLTIKPKLMTTSNITATNVVDRNLIRTAATGIALALTPMAVIFGVATMELTSAPSAEARAYICRPMPGGGGTFCSYGR